MSVVQVVGVAIVDDSGMSAILTMLMGVIFVRFVLFVLICH